MKKILSVLLSVVLMSTMCLLFVSAEESAAEINLDGYDFTINYVNGVIKGEDGVLITTTEAAQTANLKYATYFICTKISDGIYKVKGNAELGCTDPTIIALGENEILIGIHSDSAPTATNREQKKAAASVEADMFVTLSGIDLAAATVSDGKATISLTQPEGTDVSATTESSDTASTVSTESNESNESVASTASIVSEEDDDNSSQASKTSEVTSDDDDKLDTTTIVLIVAAAVVVVGAIIFIIVKKKK